MKIILPVFISFLFNCCHQSSNFAYRIPTSYIGPCLIFIIPNVNIDNEKSILLNSEGIAAITENNANKTFSIISEETKVEIPIIEIGNEEAAFENMRYIFRLSKGNSSTICDSAQINHISFFIGYKKDYLEWSNKNHSIFASFDAKGIKWCSFYKSKL